MSVRRLECVAWLTLSLGGCTLANEGLGWSVDRDDVGAADGSIDEQEPDDQERPTRGDGGGRDAGGEGTVPKTVDAGTKGDAGANGCAIDGTRALRIDATVGWEGKSLWGVVPLVWPGRGVVQIVATVEMRADANGQAGVATIRACGATVPPFVSSISEVYAVQFDDAVWDAVSTRWSVPFTQTCAQPGCTFASGRAEPQLGLALPSGAAWPAPTDVIPASQLRDDDGDGAPGIAVRSQDPGAAGAGAAFAHPPADLLLIERIDTLNLALRLGAVLEGSMRDCGEYQGTASTLSIDTRALACALDHGGPCRPDQVSFVNGNLPVWTVERATWKMVDLPAGATCAEARAAVR